MTALLGFYLLVCANIQVRRCAFASPPYLPRRMLSEDSVQYAIENTQVIRAPERRIATFGNTSFRFFLVTELMDGVDQIRVRDGRLHAERPQIVTPQNLHTMLLEGFGSRAEEFAGWLREHAPDVAALKYGFQFRKTDLQEQVVHSPLAEVLGRINETVDREEDPLSAIIQGVDEGWEVCLLKFATDMIQESAGGNMQDFRRRGLL